MNKVKKQVENQEDDIIMDDDVTFEAETDSDMVGSKSSFGGGSEESQVKKLKKKLKEAQEKAKENLDGWQRLKADVANGKQADAERLKRAKLRGAEEVLESLLPALDSFDSAMQGEAWEGIDGPWRMGMEFVYTQLTGALEGHGVIAFGQVGDTFDAALHDAASGEGEKVIKVLRKGYKSGEHIIRPARVELGV
jgi:molecular chaperone GrpE